MAYVPMNRTRALIICTRPQDYAPARLREAARYLLDRRDATEEEKRLASEAIEGLHGRRDEQTSTKETTSSRDEIATPDRRQPAKRKRKG